ncbi:sugar transferase [Pedobacter sp. SYP-B3415]|uniref:sugar transferase n=1 Tax=Pedobacter sp. SYP-B3415 TaxID=2496641 RepID=UPI00101D4C23|nr:sugar transferase [Pedobacter sp. SYP-B3415]
MNSAENLYGPLAGQTNQIKKRIADVVISLLVIVFILSWLFPIIGILIKLQSRGPILFKQLRSGRDDVPFYCYKFRSMRVNGDSDVRQASKTDDRITPIGRFLRSTSLDEFPQFINVFLGDMSVVGPRPHMIRHTEHYKQLIHRFMVRHFLKPGITGWAQISGCRGETRQKEDMERRVQHDIWYLENWSSGLDMKIVLLTMLAVIKGDENAF